MPRKASESAAVLSVVARGPGRPVSLEKRQALLASAIREFSEAGYDAANMDSVADRAGVSKRTLYNHFGSKEGLFNALVNELGKRIRQTSTLRYSATESVEAQLLVFVEESRRLMRDAETLQLLRAVLSEHVRDPRRVEPVLQSYWQGEYGFTDWVRAACGAGRLNADPTAAARIFTSLIKAILFWPVVLGRRSPDDPALDRDVAEAIEVFVGHYGGVAE